MRINIFSIVVFCSSVLGFLYISYVAQQPEILYRDIQDNLNQLLEAQDQDLDEFEEKLSVYTNPFAIPNEDETFTKHVYLNGSLIYWNNSKALPAYSRLKQSAITYTIPAQNGVDLVRRREVVNNNDLIEIFSIIPLVSNPPVINQYLQKGFNPDIFKNYSVHIEFGEKTQDAEYEMRYGDQVLFSITLLEGSNRKAEIISLVLVLLCVLTFAVLLIRNIHRWIPRRSVRLPVTLVSLILIRVVLFLWTSTHLHQLELFDPAYFTSGLLCYTLGDLLIHSFLLLYILASAYIYVQRAGWALLSTVFSRKRKGYRQGVGVVLSLGMLLLSVFSFQAIWILLENSQLELDISVSLEFDFLRLCAFASIVMIGLSVTTAFTLFLQLIDLLALSKSMVYLSFVSSFIVLSLLFGLNAFIYIGLFLLAFLIIIFFDLGTRLTDFRYQTFVFLVVIFSGFSSIFAFSLYKHHEKDDLVAKEKFGNRLLIKNDILGELFLSEIIQDIEQDPYIRTRLMSQLLARQNIREKIKTHFLSSYFKKYDINVYLFDDQGSSLQKAMSPESFSQWEEHYRHDAYATDYEKIYFVQDESESVRNKYVSFLDIEAYGRRVGYIVLDLTLKKFIPSSVFPELLLESKYATGSDNEFDYAVYRNGDILYKQGRFSFENKLSFKNLNDEKLYTRGIEKGGAHYFGVKTTQGETIVIVSRTYSERALVANFSMVFLLLLFASGMLLIVWQIYKSDSTFYLSTKIQLYLGLSFILPMLIVSIALINTLNASYKEEIDRNFQKRSYNIAENLIDATEAYIKNRINKDEYANRIAEAGAFVQADLNLYNASGKLITSSQPEIFRLGMLSDLLNPEAYYQIRYKKEQNLISDEEIGRLDFKSSYTALRSYQDGRLLAILSMPYFDSKNHLRRQQIEVFDNLISIFTIIFLISLAVGNVIVGQLVHPLRKIGHKLRQTSLQEKNLPIYYEGDDEIGSLVKEYNLMLVKLEESKEALAASQKESAWKEIARQVAHEIKNPLTPMRLKIQQMMKSFAPEDKFYKTCKILIAQVDSLSSIADSFSEFAKMPAPNNEPVNLPGLMESVISLYQSREVMIKKEFDCSDLLVYIDPKIFNRIFTNLILNAIQAKDTGRPEIIVSLRSNRTKVTVSIRDNGPGIPEEIKENIFTPYFSTKTKGSGIGLAVAKKGIENAGGNIWFESEGGKGTTFFISLPVYKA